MAEKLAINVFENLFKLTYDPIYVGSFFFIKMVKPALKIKKIIILQFIVQFPTLILIA